MSAGMKVLQRLSLVGYGIRDLQNSQNMWGRVRIQHKIVYKKPRIFQGYTRAPGLGVYFLQNSQTCRERVSEAIRTHRPCRVGYGGCTYNRTRNRAFYQELQMPSKTVREACGTNTELLDEDVSFDRSHRTIG